MSDIERAAHLHGVTPEPPPGSEQYREGWRDGYTHAAQAAARWEAATLAVISSGLDPESAERARTRIRALIEGPST
jgi:hypothetical protein